MTKEVPRRVLVIEDDPDYRNLLERFLNKAFPDADVEQYDPLAKGRPGADFDWSRFDVLILDYRLGEKENGLDWLREYKKKDAKFPATILLTAAGSEEVAVGALRFGAHDYLKKQKLNANRLSESIADAFSKRAEEKSFNDSFTINASRFSKSFFYGQFDLAFEQAEKGENRAVLLIKTDGYEALQSSLGVLVTDELERVLADTAIDMFKTADYPPRATRFTDASIALLVGGYKAPGDLEHMIGSLCERIGTSPPVVNGNPIPITLSVGAARIVSHDPGVDGLLAQAERATAEASKNHGNSFVIASADDSPAAQVDTERRADVFDAKSAMRENRIQAMFCPITGVSEASADLPFEEFFQINPRFIARNGESLPADPVLAAYSDGTLSRLVDRWKIRECIGRLFAMDAASGQTPGFMVGLSEASYNDVNLARWLVELIAYYEKQRRFEEVFLSVSPDVLMRNTKPIVALMEHLKKQQGFRFALDVVADPALVKVCNSNYPFDLVALAPEMVQKVIEKGAEHEDYQRLLNVKMDALVLARGIEDANGLHAVISAGVDFVQGDFVAPEQEELETVSGIESVHLGE